MDSKSPGYGTCDAAYANPDSCTHGDADTKLLASGTYDAATGTGGSNGAGMRFATEAGDPENAGLG